MTNRMKGLKPKKRNNNIKNLIIHKVEPQLIRYTISECLVEIQKFKKEWSITMYENTQKTQ